MPINIQLDKEDVVYIYTHTHTHTHTQWNINIKNSEIWPFEAMWMDLENTVLSEISQRLILYDTTICVI